MKVVQINTTCGIGSTGKICVGISQQLSKRNIENYILYSSQSNGYELGIPCSNNVYIKMQAFKSRILGNYGFNSQKATKKIIKKLKQINPDIVHLHNIHGHDCNLEMLFSFFKKNKTKVIWTFHDCWAFTGYCVHFDMIQCHKWEKKCDNCSQYKEYSWFCDRSNYLFRKKRDVFNKQDLTIITPSQWLAKIAKQSFLGNCPIKIINNGIDLSVFCPTKSNFREKYQCNGKILLLGVAFGWNNKKGLEVFIELSKRLDNKYQIILVGTDAQVEKLLPASIITIRRTQNQKELAAIYSAADLFVNPTQEDTFPTVNIEAIACGTPIMTFDTGGSAEIIDDTCGCIVDKNNIEMLKNEIIRVCETRPYSMEACLKRAKAFEIEYKLNEYIDFYFQMENNKSG